MGLSVNNLEQYQTRKEWPQKYNILQHSLTILKLQLYHIIYLDTCNLGDFEAFIFHYLVFKVFRASVCDSVLSPRREN